MRRADRALLAAKSSGRNRVLAETGGHVAGPEAPEPPQFARAASPRRAAITRLLTRRLVAG